MATAILVLLEPEETIFGWEGGAEETRGGPDLGTEDTILCCKVH